ncbi:hypothetical protein [Parerythrobacter aestuarii]|uniref:hypothetical protein n=1 Tax=Parerythrobacter aestuarii TaxID=3020909 RepID=UPI0024DEA529|nr:hypothetical protein [Parerythrobacter aestuarii]
MERRASLLALLLLAFGLQGCVAAVIPLAAGAAMATTVRDNPETPQVETKLSQQAAPAIAASPALRPEDSAGEGTVALALPVTDAPVEAGTNSPIPPMATTTASDAATYAAFADYALENAARTALGDALRPSALLEKPGTLTPDRAACRSTSSAVLIDLDPVADKLDPTEPMTRPALANALERLREGDVEVVWSTGLTADRAGEVREWLRRSELDSEGADRLLLLRYPEDRKQTRRNEAAQDSCLVAMLGDERADFDELFDFLKDPKAAFGLDKMLGAGWFLAPIQETSPAADDAPPANDDNEGPTP